MTIYEIGRLLAEPVLPPLYAQIRHRLRALLKANGILPDVLDVGGRKSPYTIGLPARITLIDLPRESEVQKKLNLGINDDIVEKLKARRSNVAEVIFGDMTDSHLPSESFDVVISVEVLEHVEADDQFVSEVSRVLRPGGAFFMTTPNGDWVANKNPDHKRHYTKADLTLLLKRHFDEVGVEYAIAGGKYRKLGLRPWVIARPTSIPLSILGNLVNSVQSSRPRIGESARGTHHLIALARKGREAAG